MKGLHSILLLLFISISLSAQYNTFIEEEKHWIHQTYENEESGKITGGFIVSVGESMMINGTEYTELIKQTLKGAHDCQYPPCFEPFFPYQVEEISTYAFIREDTMSGMVYMLNGDSFDCGSEDEFLLYDFSLAVGDKLNDCIRQQIVFNEYDPEGYITAHSNIFAFGKTSPGLKTIGYWTFGGLQFYAEQFIIQGVGFRFHGIIPGDLDELTDVCYGNMEDCQILSSLDSEPGLSDVEIFPNPTKGVVQVDSREHTIKTIVMYDVLGKQVAHVKANQKSSTLDLSHLENGVYHLLISYTNKKMSTHKIVLSK